MAFGHEKLDVYRAAVENVGRANGDTRFTRNRRSTEPAESTPIPMGDPDPDGT